MFFPTFSSYALLLCLVLTCCFARDTIKFENPINSSGRPLVSASEKFALGFFNGSLQGERYVGIWYYGLLPRTVVWVANRNEPVSNSTTWIFGISEDGNLMVSDGRSGQKKLTDLQNISSLSTMTLKLLDSGNLVLSQVKDSGSTRVVVWESFNEPTDTFLPGMTSERLELTSWKSQDDPAAGRYVFRLDVENQYIITDNGIPSWKSGLSGNSIANDEISPLISNLLLIISGGRAEKCYNLKGRRPLCKPTQSDNHNNTRLVMGFDGKLRVFGRDNQTDKWSLIWLEPADRCSVFDACGMFGSCNMANRVLCHCLPGFQPQSPDKWNDGDFSEGCTRKSPICSQNVKDEAFLKLSMMKVQKPHSTFPVNDANECKSSCLSKCNCHAYSYHEGEPFLRSRPSNITCSIWLDDLNNIQESYASRGPDLYLRLRAEGNKTCKPCGTNIIPYPLSTGPSCGDPMYSNFSCQTETGTGQISFNASGTTYQVTSMNPEKRRFSIQVDNAENCSARDSWEKRFQNPRSLPYFLSSPCKPTRNNFSTDFLGEDRWFYEVEIGWNIPSEPICGLSQDCKEWPNSFCNIAADGKLRCTCNPSFQWDPSTGNCIPDSLRNQSPGPWKKQKPLYLIFLVVTATMLFILCTAFALYDKRRRMVRRQGNLELSLYNSERQVIDFINSGDFRKDNKKDIDVPYFDLQTILVATDNFAESNKLGQGGFGPVYKGKLPRGQEIAIKRLSKGSGQGIEEFKNEVVLIAKLQHRNLVRLLGYCTKGYEKMLIYEYMPNRSLDSFIFDRTRCVLLNWEKRLEILLGIARGILYLHQDSRLRIVHRDLKTSNILLDEEMNPKISDFGLARIFGGNQTEASTDRVVGTYGYMSPEYALDGFFSIKSDVFSFGVVLLEIISGKRNTGFYQAEQPLNLLGYAWSLWKDGRALGLAEQALRQSWNTSEFLRCVNVGLLCVQEDPSDRPTMSDVLFMLGSETLTLPIPKQPAYVVRRSLSGSASSSSQQQWNAELTTTLEEGR